MRFPSLRRHSRFARDLDAYVDGELAHARVRVLEEHLARCTTCARIVEESQLLKRIAMGGHSFGSYVTMAMAGQSVSRDGTEIDFQDERIKCAVVISPLATRENPEEAYDLVEIPILHITGKKDDSPFGLLEPVERRVPYDNMNQSDQYLIIFEKADHLIFAAQRRQNKFSEDDVKIMELTAAAIEEFLKKYLLKQKSSIDSPEFSDRLKPHATFEKKLTS